MATFAAAAGIVLAPGPRALAQPDSAAANAPATTAQGLTIIAPKVVRRETTGAATFVGAPIEVLSLARTVSFADLDLSTDAGATEFKKRIMYNALAACDELEAEYPSNIYVPVPAGQNCPDTTARAGLAVADEIISAAKGHTK
ncbi:MAG TPA: UrcA family protein [Caulobacteraceae bacterium]|nr:UrcA family protein [Caulobacteraceae bacterium]